MSNIQIQIQPVQNRSAASTLTTNTGKMIRLPVTSRRSGRPLTENDEYTLETVRKTTERHYADCKLPFDEALWQTFADQYEKSLTRTLAGVQVMTGPTTLLFTRNTHTEPTPYDENDPYYGIKTQFIETRQDIKAILGLRGQRLMENGTLVIDKYMSKVTLTACTRKLERPEDLAQKLDQELVRTLRYMASLNMTDWSVIDRTPGAYVLVHPDRLHLVPSRFRSITHTSEFMGLDEAVISYKVSDFEAAIYYAPYVGLRQRDVGETGNPEFAGLSHRYGMATDHRYLDNPNVWCVPWKA